MDHGPVAVEATASAVGHASLGRLDKREVVTTDGHMMKEADDLMKRNLADKVIGKDDSIGKDQMTALCDSN